MMNLMKNLLMKKKCQNDEESTPEYNDYEENDETNDNEQNDEER